MRLNEALPQFIARYLDLTRDGNQYRSKCAFHTDDAQSLVIKEDSWRCLGCSEQEVNGVDAIGFFASWLGITRDLAAAKLGNGATLPPSKPIPQAKLKRPAFFGVKQAHDRPEARIWVHDLAEAVWIARELIPDRVHVGLIEGRSWDDLGLPPARQCVLIPCNTASARATMDKLAERLHSAGHTVRVVNPTDREEFWSLVDAHSEGMTAEQVVTWVGKRASLYLNDAAQPQSPGREGIPPKAEAASPPVPPLAEAAKTQPRPAQAAGKLVLAVVDPSGALRKPDPEPDPDQLPAFSEFALADTFIAKHGEDWRYTDEEKVWRKWDGLLWREDKDKTITWEVTQCNRAVIHAHLADSTPANRMKAAQLRTTNAVIGLALSYREVAVTKDTWNAHPMLLGTPAGLIDLETGKLQEPRKSAMITKATLIAPASGEHPYWDMVLARASGGDTGMLHYLQKLIGYSLTGDTRQEAMFYLHGPGNSGKSKFILPIQEIMGDYAKSFEIDLFLAGAKENMSEKFAQLADVRLAIGSEPQEGGRWHEGRLKLATGRNRISCRDVYAKRMEYLPQFKIWVEGNSRPALNSVGEEIRRRFHLIEYKGGVIPEDERILDLPDKLRAEYPQILQWAIEGTQAWLAEGLGLPEQVSHDVDEYLSDEDTLGAWFAECVIRDPDARTYTNDAYLSYKPWADARGEYVPPQKVLTQRIRNRGYAIGKSGTKFFRGFRLKDSGFERDDEPRNYADR